MAVGEVVVVVGCGIRNLSLFCPRNGQKSIFILPHVQKNECVASHIHCQGEWISSRHPRLLLPSLPLYSVSKLHHFLHPVLIRSAGKRSECERGKKRGVVACSGKSPLFPLPSYFVVSGAEEEGELGVEKKQQKHNISHINQSPLFPHLISQISATYFSNNPTFCIGVGRQEGQHQEERRPHLGKHSFFVGTLFFLSRNSLFHKN